MSEVSVESKIVIKQIWEITPYKNNPRRNEKAIELLCKIIPKVGFNVPLVIDSENVIVKGHARYEAAKRLGIKEIPCIVTHADPDLIKADRIADNKIHEFSDWINEELMHEVDMFDLGFEIEEFGLPRIQLGEFPTLDEFTETEEEYEQMSEEDIRKIYEEYLAKKSETENDAHLITTESDINFAEAKQKEVPRKPRDYAMVICPKCGKKMYVDKNVLYNRNGTIRR